MRLAAARAPRTVVFAVLLLAIPLLGADAQRCDTTTSRTVLAAHGGDRIAAVLVQADGLEPSRAGAALGRLHVRTREATIRRQLLFAAGDTVDTLAVGESLRRLRRLRYLADAEIVAVSCGGGNVQLTVHTRDAWSAKASARTGASGSAIAVTERNALGTGREVTLAARSEDGRLGLGGAVRDPSVLGGPIALQLGRLAFRDGDESFVSLARRPGPPDQVEISLDAARRVRQAPGDGEAFRRLGADGLVALPVHRSAEAIGFLLAGAHLERTALVAGAGSRLVGPEQVRRVYGGLDLGVSRRAVRFDTLTWLLPGGGISDVPMAMESEVVVGAGREWTSDRLAGRVDLYAGRMWLPGRRLLLTADLWGGGFRRAGSPSEAGTARLALAAFVPADRGLWRARLAVERLHAPDPDTRALASADPFAPALGAPARLAEGGASAMLERELWLRGAGRSWTVGAALFGGGTLRWETSATGAGPVALGAVGVGLRLLPRRAGRGTVRLDLGFPLAGTAAAPRRPWIGISVSPAFDALRHRDGRRER